MSRPPPLHVTLGRLTSEAREKMAKEKLNLDAVRDAASKAALQGLNVVTIPLGAAFLGKTHAGKALADTFKGFSLEWIEVVSRDGAPAWELRLSWNILEGA